MGEKRGPYAVGEKRKAQILAATERLVLEHGHTTLTIRMVARSLGITDTAVYHHFATKDVLLVELLRYRESTAPERDLAPDLAAVLTTAVEHSQETPAMVALFADFAARAGDPEHPAHAFFTERYTSLVDSIAELVRGQQEKGAISAAIPAGHIANILFAVSDGLQTHWLVTRDLDMASTMGSLFELLRTH